jgi:tetratricopeptide (TPR) repeat protein
VLLDRKRVKFWQKWVFGFMAIIMAAFLIMIPVNRSLGCGGTSSALKQIDKDIATYKAAVRANPQNVDAWRKLGENYLLSADQQTAGSAQQTSDWNSAVTAYEHANKLLGKKKGAANKQLRIDTLQNLVSVYVSLKNYQKATSTYLQITALTPKDAQAYFEMASVAIEAGDTNTALLAFNKFLELDPKSPDAASVKAWIKQNAPSTAPTKGSSK